MTLQYIPDWDETQQRLRAWWKHEYVGRCALSVAAPLDNPPARTPPPAATTVEEQWYDLDAIAARTDYDWSRIFFWRRDCSDLVRGVSRNRVDSHHAGVFNPAGFGNRLA